VKNKLVGVKKVGEKFWSGAKKSGGNLVRENFSHPFPSKFGNEVMRFYEFTKHARHWHLKGYHKCCKFVLMSANKAERSILRKISASMSL